MPRRCPRTSCGASAYRASPACSGRSVRRRLRGYLRAASAQSDAGLAAESRGPHRSGAADRRRPSRRLRSRSRLVEAGLFEAARDETAGAQADARAAGTGLAEVSRWASRGLTRALDAAQRGNKAVGPLAHQCRLKPTPSRLMRGGVPPPASRAPGAYSHLLGGHVAFKGRAPHRSRFDLDAFATGYFDRTYQQGCGQPLCLPLPC